MTTLQSVLERSGGEMKEHEARAMIKLLGDRDINTITDGEWFRALIPLAVAIANRSPRPASGWARVRPDIRIAYDYVQGYNASDYFRNGQFLGPDSDGLYPTFD